jgi:hypothetical protein
MSNEKSKIDSILELNTLQPGQAALVNKYETLGLKFNPFPRSGTANMNSNDSYTENLVPVRPVTLSKVADYIRRALVPNVLNPDDKLVTGVIIGNYGMGKTQLLLYIKSLLTQLYKSDNPLINAQRPYVVYIDNPGVSISELIGSIIKDIGEENFRKFLWKNIIVRVEKETQYKDRLRKFIRTGSSQIFETGKNPDPFHETNKVSYKLFIDAFINRLAQAKERKLFEQEIRAIITNVLHVEFNDAVLAEYFYDIVSNDLGVNSTWEAFVSGSGKHIEGKETEIIKVIFRIAREQGFTHFFVLVDEFEDVSQGRLKKDKLDNYLYNLRTLVDENREWCLLFAMIPDALRQVRKNSLPLAQRISTITIELEKLDSKDASRIISNYLNLARLGEESDLKPFSADSIKYLNNLEEIDGTPRTLLQQCFALVETAADLKQPTIDENFMKIHVRF